MYCKNYNVIVHKLRGSPRTLVTPKILRCYNLQKHHYINYRLMSNSYQPR